MASLLAVFQSRDACLSNQRLQTLPQRTFFSASSRQKTPPAPTHENRRSASDVAQLASGTAAPARTNKPAVFRPDSLPPPIQDLNTASASTSLPDPNTSNVAANVTHVFSTAIVGSGGYRLRQRAGNGSGSFGKHLNIQSLKKKHLLLCMWASGPGVTHFDQRTDDDDPPIVSSLGTLHNATLLRVSELMQARVVYATWMPLLNLKRNSFRKLKLHQLAEACVRQPRRPAPLPSDCDSACGAVAKDHDLFARNCPFGCGDDASGAGVGRDRIRSDDGADAPALGLLGEPHVAPHLTAALAASLANTLACCR